VASKKQMRSGPATQTAFVRGFLLGLVTAWWRNDCFSRPALQKSAAFAEADCRFVIVRSRTCNRCGGQRVLSCSLLPAQKNKEQRAGWGRKAATPGQPVALARVFRYVLRRFTLESRRWPLALPQSFGELRNSHVSLNQLSPTLLRLATQKSCVVVQKLWRMRLPCGRPRKTKNQFSRRIHCARAFNNLDAVELFLA